MICLVAYYVTDTCANEEFNSEQNCCDFRLLVLQTGGMCRLHILWTNFNFTELRSLGSVLTCFFFLNVFGLLDILHPQHIIKTRVLEYFHKHYKI